MVRHVNGVSRIIYLRGDRKAAHSLLDDLDVAIVDVTGAAGVSVKHCDVRIAGHWNEHDVLVLIDCNTATENIIVAPGVRECANQDRGRRSLRTAGRVGAVASGPVNYRHGQVTAVADEN